MNIVEAVIYNNISLTGTNASSISILAAKYTATNPARVIGIDSQTGSLEPGKCADIAVLDSDYNCIATFVDGNMVYSS